MQSLLARSTQTSHRSIGAVLSRESSSKDGPEMKTSTILKKARALVAKGWCQQNWAEDRKGVCSTDDGHTAVRWCAWGALYTISHNGPCTEAGHWLSAMVPPGGVIPFNDASGRTRADVLDVYDAAIFMAQRHEEAA
jgi:hypothetical protein